LVLFVIFIIASFVELTFGGFGGSVYLAIIFFVISLFLLAKIKGSEQTRLKPSKKFILLGCVIIIADIIYNVKKGSDFGTLDTTLIFLGISMIALSLKNKDISSLGEFGVYFSSIALALFLLLYAIPSRLGSNIYDYYGYYAVTIPSIFILKSLNLSLHLDSLTTIHAYGVEDVSYQIDLGCFGFYSMILIISTVVAYRMTLAKKNSHSIAKIAVILVLASYFANLLRVMGLVYIGYYYGLGTMQVFHTFLGWILFAGIVLPITYFYLK
ncbi:MAG TPA: archaeosortase C, partial [Candidatus Methanoperedens sp.]